MIDSESLFSLPLILLLIFSIDLSSSSSSSCSISNIFHGQWIEPGLNDPITINRTSMSSKGVCLEGNDYQLNKYLFFNEQTRCRRCLFFIFRHFNAIQYRESECFDADDNDHERICSSITPDTVLYTLFRDQADSIVCPIERIWSFELDRQTFPSCQPKSFHPCSTRETFLLSYDERCPTNRLIGTCFAEFTDGNLHHVISRDVNQKKFFCFSFVKSKFDFSPNEIYFSDDETCRHSMRLLTIKHADDYRSNLLIPKWMQGVWNTMINQSTTIEINTSHLMKFENRQIIHRFQFVRLLKMKNELTDRIIRLRAHSIEQCSSVFYCFKFVFRSLSVIDLSIGMSMNSSSDSDERGCRPTRFHYTLFKSDISSNSSCPNAGIYETWSVQNSIASSCSTGGQRILSIGCSNDQKNEFTLTSSCRHDLIADVQLITSIKGICLASWRIDQRFQRTLVLYDDNKAFCLIQSFKSTIVSWILSDLSCSKFDQSNIQVENSLNFIERCPLTNSGTSVTIINVSFLINVMVLFFFK